MRVLTFLRYLDVKGDDAKPPPHAPRVIDELGEPVGVRHHERYVVSREVVAVVHTRLHRLAAYQPLYGIAAATEAHGVYLAAIVQPLAVHERYVLLALPHVHEGGEGEVRYVLPAQKPRDGLVNNALAVAPRPVQYHQRLYLRLRPVNEHSPEELLEKLAQGGVGKHLLQKLEPHRSLRERVAPVPDPADLHPLRAEVMHSPGGRVAHAVRENHEPVVGTKLPALDNAPANPRDALRLAVKPERDPAFPHNVINKVREVRPRQRAVHPPVKTVGNTVEHSQTALPQRIAQQILNSVNLRKTLHVTLGVVKLITAHQRQHLTQKQLVFQCIHNTSL